MTKIIRLTSYVYFICSLVLWAQPTWAQDSVPAPSKKEPVEVKKKDSNSSTVKTSSATPKKTVTSKKTEYQGQKSAVKIKTRKQLKKLKQRKKARAKARARARKNASKRSVKRKGTKRKRFWPKNRVKRPLKPVPSLGKIPFPLGEKLTYKINLLNAHSGTAILQVGHRGTYKGRRVVELVGSIKSSPLLKNFYPIQDRLSVLVDESTFKPVRSHFHLKEKGNEIIYLSEYNPEKASLVWKKEKTLAGQKKRVYNEQHQGPSSGLYESLSSLYAIRRLDLKVGLHFEQYVWDGQRERLVEVKVLGEDRIFTDLGWIETYKVEIQSRITGGFISKRLLKAQPMKGIGWFAKDAYRTPVKVVTPTRLGQAEAVLTQRTIEEPKKQ